MSIGHTLDIITQQRGSMEKSESSQEWRRIWGSGNRKREDEGYWAHPRGGKMEQQENEVMDTRRGRNTQEKREVGIMRMTRCDRRGILLGTS